MPSRSVIQSPTTLITAPDVSARDLRIATMGRSWDLVVAGFAQAGVPMTPAPPPPVATSSFLKPLNPASPWRRRIDADASRVRSAASDSRAVAVRSIVNSIIIKYATFGQRLYEAVDSDPNVTWIVTDPNGQNQFTWTFKEPAGAYPDIGNGAANSQWAQPAGDRDAHMCVYWANFAGGTFPSIGGNVTLPAGPTWLDVWLAYKDGSGQRRATSAAMYSNVTDQGVYFTGQSLTTLGGVYAGKYNSPKVRQAGWGACKAYGGCSPGGLIRAGEIVGTGGIVDHAIAFLCHPSQLAYGRGLTGTSPAVRNGVTSYPAAKDDNNPNYGGQAGNTTLPDMGTCFTLPASFDVNAQTWDDGVKRFAQGVKDYGMYIMDESLGPGIQGDGVAAAADCAYLAARITQIRQMWNSLVVVSPPPRTLSNT